MYKITYYFSKFKTGAIIYVTSFLIIIITLGFFVLLLYYGLEVDKGNFLWLSSTAVQGLAAIIAISFVAYVFFIEYNKRLQIENKERFVNFRISDHLKSLLTESGTHFIDTGSKEQIFVSITENPEKIEGFEIRVFSKLYQMYREDIIIMLLSCSKLKTNAEPFLGISNEIINGLKEPRDENDDVFDDPRVSFEYLNGSIKSLGVSLDRFEAYIQSHKKGPWDINPKSEIAEIIENIGIYFHRFKNEITEPKYEYVVSDRARLLRFGNFLNNAILESKSTVADIEDNFDFKVREFNKFFLLLERHAEYLKNISKANKVVKPVVIFGLFALGIIIATLIFGDKGPNGYFFISIFVLFIFYISIILVGYALVSFVKK